MYKEIGIEEAVGKTVKAIVFSDINGGMAISFVDKTFIVFGIDRSYGYGCEEEIEVKAIDFADFPYNKILEAGIATAEELDILSKERQAKSECREREQYEMLRKKYEN